MTKIEKTEIIIEVEKCDDCDNHFGCQCMLTADHKDIDDCLAYPPVWCPLPEKPEVNPNRELILECCGKPESQCKCEER